MHMQALLQYWKALEKADEPVAKQYSLALAAARAEKYNMVRDALGPLCALTQPGVNAL